MKKVAFGVAAGNRVRTNKYWHYVFIVSLLVMAACVLGLLNGFYHLVDVSPYSADQGVVASSSFELTGYLGMFVGLWVSPIPDYILVPVYGFLSSIGLFSPVETFLVCLAAAVLPIEFFCGKYAARPLVVRALSFFHMSEKDLEVAEKWLVNHGHFSIFIATFIPFFYSVAALAAGTLKMGSARFLVASTVGFAVRYLFLEYVGYFSIYIFSPSFDYSERTLFAALLFSSFVYAALYLVGVFGSGSSG